MTDLSVLFGVRCNAEIAAKRELARGDRAVGMAHGQAEIVHRGIAYDLEVDTTHATPAQSAAIVVAALRDLGWDEMGQRRGHGLGAEAERSGK